MNRNTHNQHPLDEVFRKVLDNFEAGYRKEDWEAMEAKLNQQTAPPPYLITSSIVPYIAAAVLLVGIVFGWMFWTNSGYDNTEMIGKNSYEHSPAHNQQDNKQSSSTLNNKSQNTDKEEITNKSIADRNYQNSSTKVFNSSDKAISGGSEKNFNLSGHTLSGTPIDQMKNGQESAFSSNEINKDLTSSNAGLSPIHYSNNYNSTDIYSTKTGQINHGQLFSEGQNVYQTNTHNASTAAINDRQRSGNNFPVPNSVFLESKTLSYLQSTSTNNRIPSGINEFLKGPSDIVFVPKLPKKIKYKPKFNISAHSSMDANFVSGHNASPGYTAGLALNMTTRNSGWSLESGVFLSNKTFQIPTNENLSVSNSPALELTQSHYNYLEMPFLVKYLFNAKGNPRPYFAAGPCLYIPFSEKYTYQYNYEQSPYDSKNKRLPAKTYYDIISLRVGVDFSLSKKWNMILEGQFKSSIGKHRLERKYTHLDNNPNNKYRIMSAGFQLGVGYNL